MSLLFLCCQEEEHKLIKFQGARNGGSNLIGSNLMKRGGNHKRFWFLSPQKRERECNQWKTIQSHSSKVCAHIIQLNCSIITLYNIIFHHHHHLIAYYTQSRSIYPLTFRKKSSFSNRYIRCCVCLCISVCLSLVI